MENWLKKYIDKKLIGFLLFLSFTLAGKAQYSFTLDKEVKNTNIKNQEKTGTCWSFATSSFLESEIIKKTGKDLNLSEMYVVRKIYGEKAQNYVLRQGKANFSQGSLAHDLIRGIAKYGIIPEQYYNGKLIGEDQHNHSEMVKGLKGFLDGVISNGTLTPKWKIAFASILDAYMGKVPEKFEYEGQLHTPMSFANMLGIQSKDYISLTSFSHHPFYETFILEIPDNFSNGSYFNLPLDELEEIVDFAIISGFSIVWDGDVSEPGFSHQDGLAIVPTDGPSDDMFSSPVPQIRVTQELRQQQFESYQTTDDHLMHIVGIALDQNGDKYYMIKNSWGPKGRYIGYMYMSQSYFRLKTVGISLNKEALPMKTSRRLFASE